MNEGKSSRFLHTNSEVKHSFFLKIDSTRSLLHKERIDQTIPEDIDSTIRKNIVNIFLFGTADQHICLSSMSTNILILMYIIVNLQTSDMKVHNICTNNYKTPSKQNLQKTSKERTEGKKKKNFASPRAIPASFILF